MALHRHDRICVFLRWGIGDVILQWPVLQALRRARPDAHLTLVAARPALELLDGAGLADALACYQDLGMRHIGDGDAAASRRVAAWLDEARFDAVADLMAAPPAARRVGWRSGPAYYESDRSATRAALAAGADAAGAHAAGAAAGWGLPGLPGRDGARPRLDVSERQAEAGRILEARGVADRPWIALVPSASHPLKRWPAHRFGALADLLGRRGDAVLILAAPGGGAAERVRGAARLGADAVVPPLDLRTTAALLARATAAVGNDTGLMHLAAAVETPTVTLFGPSDARVYAPAGHGGLAVRARRPCAYRQDRSLSPPGCWTSDRCLVAARSCIEEVTVTAVLRRLARPPGACAPG